MRRVTAITPPALEVLTEELARPGTTDLKKGYFPWKLTLEGFPPSFRPRSRPADRADRLNNFHTNLPGGGARKDAELYGPDETHGQRLLSKRVGNERAIRLCVEGHSLKYLRQTPAAFFAEIDRAVEALGLTPEYCAQAKQQLTDEQWGKLKLAIYRQLINAGYTHYDLCM